MRLYLIRPNGSGLTPLTEGYIEHITNLTASPDGEYLLFAALREDTCPGDGGVGYFDLSHLYMVDIRSGEIFTLTSGTTSEEQLAVWSPDGQRIAFVSSEVNIPCSPSPPCYEEGCTPMVLEFHPHLYVMNRDGTGKRKLTPQEGWIDAVAWSPTGERILFTQHGAVWVVNPDGSGLFKVADAFTTYHRRSYAAQPAWSPDGRQIAFVAPGIGQEHYPDIFVVNVDSSGLFNLTHHPAEDFQPAWSPDGQHIAFVTSRKGIWAIYVIDIDGTNAKEVFYSPSGSAEQPTWSPDGTQIALIGGGGEVGKDLLFVVDLASGSPHQLGKEYVVEDHPVWVRLPPH